MILGGKGKALDKEKGLLLTKTPNLIAKSYAPKDNSRFVVEHQEDALKVTSVSLKVGCSTKEKNYRFGNNLDSNNRIYFYISKHLYIVNDLGEMTKLIHTQNYIINLISYIEVMN